MRLYRQLVSHVWGSKVRNGTSDFWNWDLLSKTCNVFLWQTATLLGGRSCRSVEEDGRKGCYVTFL